MAKAVRSRIPIISQFGIPSRASLSAREEKKYFNENVLLLSLRL